MLTDSDRREIQGAFNTRKRPSDHAMQVLRQVRSYGDKGIPAQEMNFTVRDKLHAFGYICLRDAPSDGWYKTHKPGRTVTFAFITEKGRSALT